MQILLALLSALLLIFLCEYLDEPWRWVLQGAIGIIVIVYSLEWLGVTALGLPIPRSWG